MKIHHILPLTSSLLIFKGSVTTVVKVIFFFFLISLIPQSSFSLGPCEKSEITPLFDPTECNIGSFNYDLNIVMNTIQSTRSISNITIRVTGAKFRLKGAVNTAWHEDGQYLNVNLPKVTKDGCSGDFFSLTTGLEVDPSGNKWKIYILANWNGTYMEWSGVNDPYFTKRPIHIDTDGLCLYSYSTNTLKATFSTLDFRFSYNMLYEWQVYEDGIWTTIKTGTEWDERGTDFERLVHLEISNTMYYKTEKFRIRIKDDQKPWHYSCPVKVSYYPIDCPVADNN